MSEKTLPTQAEIVIIGGGIVGCSTAYHLAKMGKKDVILLEQAELTSGSTFHAAGLVGQLRSSSSITQLLKESVELYENIEQETGLSTGWKMNGGLRLACNKERMTEYKRAATTARSFGMEMHMITPQEAYELWPMMDVSDLVGAAFIPTDGQANPSDITFALAKGARQNGVRIFEKTTVKKINLNKDEIDSVETDQGTIKCDIIINCAGQWAKKVGQMAGVTVPVQSVQHQYAVTEAIEGVTKAFPTLRDPDRLIYFKEEVGGLVMGGYEQNPISWADDGIPEGFNFTLLNSNWDQFEPLMEQALIRVPAMEQAGIRQLINGPEAFTPDGTFILGEAPNVKNFFVGAGFNAFGIASAGGAGKALAEWVIHGEATRDLWSVDIRRFAQLHEDQEWVKSRTLELYGKHYTIGWPHEEHESGRPFLKSPLYPQLKKEHACFGSKLGWERPNWFANDNKGAKDEYSFGRQNWFENVGLEHSQTRESAALFDQSSFAKFKIKGKDAEKALSWVCANDVTKGPGSLTYTQMLNNRGGIECDLTVARLTDDEFYIVTGTGFRTHDFAWIKQNMPQGLQVNFEDVTEKKATLALMGPRARDILQSITDDDVSHSALPFAKTKKIKIDGVSVQALRVTFVGELGWELHMPRSGASKVFKAIKEAGKKYNIVNAGYRAIETLRLEKGYRVWGSDITPSDNPFEAGLGWAVKLKKDIDFKGREAAEKINQSSLSKKMACFTVDDPHIILLGRETIYRNGERVGWLTSGGWGYTVNSNIGYGYVRNPDGVTTNFLKEGVYELEVATERVSANIHFAPLYDPKMEKIKA